MTVLLEVLDDDRKVRDQVMRSFFVGLSCNRALELKECTKVSLLVSQEIKVMFLV